MVDHFLGKPMDFGSFAMFLYEIITWPSHLAGQPQSQTEKVAG